MARHFFDIFSYGTVGGIFLGFLVPTCNHHGFRTISLPASDKTELTKHNPAKGTEGAKTASEQEPLKKHSKSASCAHTLHTCSPHKPYLETIFEQMVSRDRVNSTTFSVHVSVFRFGFIEGKHQKPQPEARKYVVKSRMSGPMAPGLMAPGPYGPRALWLLALRPLALWPLALWPPGLMAPGPDGPRA